MSRPVSSPRLILTTRPIYTHGNYSCIGNVSQSTEHLRTCNADEHAVHASNHNSNKVFVRNGSIRRPLALLSQTRNNEKKGSVLHASRVTTRHCAQYCSIFGVRNHYKHCKSIQQNIFNGRLDNNIH